MSLDYLAGLTMDSTPAAKLAAQVEELRADKRLLDPVRLAWALELAERDLRTRRKPAEPSERARLVATIYRRGHPQSEAAARVARRVLQELNDKAASS